MNTTHANGRADLFKAIGQLCEMVEPARGDYAPIWLCEFQPQTATHREGVSVELSGRTQRVCASRKVQEHGIELAEGDHVVVLIDPANPKRIGRVIGRTNPPEVRGKGRPR